MGHSVSTGLTDATGFLALDPRVSIVRDLPAQGPLPDGAPAVGDRRVVAALSDPGHPRAVRGCMLDAERLEPRRGLPRRPGDDRRRSCRNRRPTALADRLEDGADVFHYVGHGMPGALAFVGKGEAVALLPATAAGDQPARPRRAARGPRSRATPAPSRAGRVGLGRDRLVGCRDPGGDRDARTSSGWPPRSGSTEPSIGRWRPGGRSTRRWRQGDSPCTTRRRARRCLPPGRATGATGRPGAVSPAGRRAWRSRRPMPRHARRSRTSWGCWRSVRANDVEAGGEVVGAKAARSRVAGSVPS